MLKLKDKILGTDATSRGLQIGESFEGTKLPLLDKWKELVWSRFSLMHPVLNIAYMPPQDPYTRPMRSTVLLCTVFGGLVSSALIYGKAPPATIPDKIVAGVIGAAIMSITPAIIIALFLAGTGSTTVAKPKEPAPPKPSMERETAYQRQVRVAHEARMSKMNPIQKALYLMRNPAAKPPPDPAPPKRKPIPVHPPCTIVMSLSIYVSVFDLHSLRCSHAAPRVLCDAHNHVRDDVRARPGQRVARIRDSDHAQRLVRRKTHFILDGQQLRAHNCKLLFLECACCVCRPER